MFDWPPLGSVIPLKTQAGLCYISNFFHEKEVDYKLPGVQLQCHKTRYSLLYLIPTPHYYTGSTMCTQLLVNV